MATDSDTLIVILLWLLYVCLHVCFNYCERRTLLRAEELEARESAQSAAARLNSQQRSSQRGISASGDTMAPIAVIVLGAERDTHTSLDEPCEGAIVPDANGRMPVLTEQAHYGEAAYTNRSEDGSAADPEKVV
ncbi:hypothetical protein LPMP_311730 [Leishmania panamensis]|uniref:Uncharacterized protein n=1 Tax=Leishmania panamensis TaxID=5679 RepID=A0A088RXP7_LEIPA|nr:hypothetical protein LPMP_311730 [Leishmania panamensis]AIO00764.1 hypothetical protein LPMP_311730 [Leishmania panamensis]